MLFKIIVLKSLQILLKRNCVGVFFSKVPDTQNRNFIKNRLQHKLFPVKFAKFLRTPCFTEQWLLLTVSGFLPASPLKKRVRQRFFSVNFAKVLRLSFLLTQVFVKHFIHEQEVALQRREEDNTNLHIYEKNLFHTPSLM